MDAPAEACYEIRRIFCPPKRLLSDGLNDSEHILDAMTEFTDQQVLRLFVPLALTDVACGPEPFDDLAIFAKNRNGSGRDPPRCTIEPLDQMLEIKRGSAPDRFIDGGQNLRLIVRMNIRI